MLRRYIVLFAAVAIVATGCETAQPKTGTGEPDKPKSKVESEAAQFLKINKDSPELFKVLWTSERYAVAQMNFEDQLKRQEDAGGDKYMAEELKKFDKIDHQCEGVLSISIRPDNGRIAKVRPKELTYLMEIDKLIVEDIQRWNFQFPANTYNPPLRFDVRYRVVLRKQQTDEEIMKEVREKLKEKTPQ
jgi:hypothetical protein